MNKPDIFSSVWETDGKIGDNIETITNELNSNFPDNKSSNEDLVDSFVKELNQLVRSYFPECLVGKRVRIYSEMDNTIGTQNRDDVCVVQEISFRRSEVFKEKKKLVCYVENRNGFNYTAFFDWETCKDYIKLVD